MIFMNSNQNVKKPAEAGKNTQQQDHDKDKTAKKGAQPATGEVKNFEVDRQDQQGDDVIGTQHGHTNKAMGNAANPAQQQKDNAGAGQHDGSNDKNHDKNKSKDAGGHDKHQGSADKHQGSGGGQHKH